MTHRSASPIALEEELPIECSAPAADRGGPRGWFGNAAVLRARLLLAQAAPATEDPAGEAGRLEAKVDLLIGLVASLASAGRPLPPTRPVRLEAERLSWRPFPEDAAGVGAREVRLYLVPDYPVPLQLAGEVTAAGDGWLRLGFGSLGPEADDLLGQVLFRAHRREVARRRGREGDG